MKIFGYSRDALKLNDVVSEELAEIALEASSDEIRMIAEFLNKTADRMDSMGKSYDHEHLSDANHYFENSPHFVVVKSK